MDSEPSYPPLEEEPYELFSLLNFSQSDPQKRILVIGVHNTKTQEIFFRSDLVPSDHEILCIDPSSNDCKVSLLSSSSGSLPFADQSFDIVYTEYQFQESSTLSFVKDVERILKPGGFFLANKQQFKNEEVYYLAQDAFRASGLRCKKWLSPFHSARENNWPFKALEQFERWWHSRLWQESEQYWLFYAKKPGKTPSLKTSSHIAVFALDEIGDVVMATPFLRELRANTPKANISLIVKPALYNLVEHCPYVDQIYTFDGGQSWRYPHRGWFKQAFLLCARHFWMPRFDLALIPRWDIDFRNALLLAWISFAKNRVGYSEKVTEEKHYYNKGFDYLLTYPVMHGLCQHEVEQNLHLLDALGGTISDNHLELWLKDADFDYAKDFIKRSYLMDGERLVALAPGAGDKKRAWPIERYMEIIKYLLSERPTRVLILGGKNEIPLVRQLEHTYGVKVINAVNQTTLRQTAALLNHCSFLIANDSSIAHLAAVFEKPSLVISCHPKTGSPLSRNAPERFRPWQTNVVVLQPEIAKSPCQQECSHQEAHCILEVTSARVIEALKNFSSLKNSTLPNEPE